MTEQSKTTCQAKPSAAEREAYHIFKACWQERIDWTPSPYQFFVWLRLYNLDALKEATRGTARWIGKRQAKNEPVTEDDLVSYYSATARSHVVHGKRALILPCLGRTDKDHQASGEQGVTVEDSMSMVHISHGIKEPSSPHQRSECAILAGMAKATLRDSKTPWQDYVTNYDRIRDTMERVLEGFEEFNRRARHPHGFRIAQPARDRIFKTPSSRAEFSTAPLPADVDPGNGRLLLTTVRSHDQFNTTIYSNNDRYRGLKGLRTVVYMNED